MLNSNIKKSLTSVLYGIIFILFIILTPTIIDILLNLGRFIGSFSREISNYYL